MSDPLPANVISIEGRRLGEGGAAVAGGGGGPHDPTMDIRLTRLEQDFKDFRSELRDFRQELAGFRADVVREIASVPKDLGSEILGIRSDVGGIKGELGELRGRLAHLPTTWVMVTALLGSQITLAGLVYIVARTLGRG